MPSGPRAVKHQFDKGSRNMDKNTMLWLGVAAFAAAVWLFSRLLKRRNRRRDLERSAEDKLREEALDRALVDRPPSADPVPSIPFEVRYDQNKKSGTVPRDGEIMLQITERGELSTRKYMLHVTSRITLGSSAGENDIVVSGRRIAPRQCEIFHIGRELFVKNLAPTKAQVLLNRGRRRLTVGAEAVQLRSGDELLIGAFVYEITIL